MLKLCIFFQYIVIVCGPSKHDAHLLNLTLICRPISFSEGEHFSAWDPSGVSSPSDFKGSNHGSQQKQLTNKTRKYYQDQLGHIVRGYMCADQKVY